MARKKLLLFCSHEGLIRLLTDLWIDHYDIYLQSPCRKFPHIKMADPEKDKDIDLVVSTLFHNELQWFGRFHDGSYPVVAYVTDPFGEEQRNYFRLCDGNPWFHTVGCEPCYPPRLVWPCTDRIQYACKPERFQGWTGTSEKIAVINKHPDYRFKQAQQRAFANGQPGAPETAKTVAEALDGLSWERLMHAGWPQLMDMLKKCRVLFNFGCTPYNCVMFEAMTMGIPIVSYNDHWDADYFPVEEYLTHYSTDIYEIRSMLLDHLRRPPQRVTYPIPSFREIQTRWLDYFDNIL